MVGCGGTLGSSPVVAHPATSNSAILVKPIPITGISTAPPLGAPPLCNVTYASLDVPDATATTLNGINGSEIMVGTYVDNNYIAHGFSYFIGGAITKIDSPSAALDVPAPDFDSASIAVEAFVSSFTGISGFQNGTEVTAISKSGEIAGVQRVHMPGIQDTLAQPFIYSNGKFTPLQLQNLWFEPALLVPRGINSAGVVVGIGIAAQNFAWIYNPDGTDAHFYRNFTSDGFASGINEAGKIIGAGMVFTPNFNAPPYPDPTSAANGTFEPLAVPGVDAIPLGINNADQVVGTFGFPGGNFYSGLWGFLKTGTQSCSLSVPGSRFTQATSVSDEGMIVGRYLTGTVHGFIASPR
jgi:uncharacterized membrane protein